MKPSFWGLLWIQDCNGAFTLTVLLERPPKVYINIENGLLCHLPFTYILRHSGLGAFFRGP
ncbi:unnamed protein product [Acanthoscelides obtectus]|uniref:LAGLIDADG homing endonuclease n=1 Tax=Acanthoscelides obtectus TaxID=200917 RepID=A0A9P0P7Z9_ACAOB|nr:unnamed protein product [Acanthoscelides obtectus]CAK1638620.1 hypothetical protein AOBTE_LOCUS10704 [Acanthoscelides obtectus]